MITYVEFSDSESALVMREAVAIAADRIFMEALLTPEQAAKTLSVSRATVNRMPIKRCKLGGCTRYRMRDLLEYANSTRE